MTTRPISNVVTTWTNSGTSYTGLGINVYSSAYATDSRPFNIRINGNSIFSVDPLGTIRGNSVNIMFATANAAYNFANTLAVASGDPSFAFRQANTAFDKANAGFTTANTAYDQANIASSAGKVDFFARNTAPTGWIKANGAAISRTLYSALFAAIGTTFGSGDGSTTFNVPDLRGYFPRGWVDNGSIDSGRSFGSSQNDAIRNISGRVIYTVNGLSITEPSGPNGAFYGSVGTSYAAQTNSNSGAVYPRDIYFDASTQVPTASDNRPYNVALLACIKY